MFGATEKNKFFPVCFEASYPERVIHVHKIPPEHLQREDMDMVTAVNAMQTLISQLKGFRNEEKLAEFVKTAKAKAIGCGIHEDFDTQKKKEAFSHSIATHNEGENTTVIGAFRREFYFPFLDLLLSEVQKRF